MALNGYLQQTQRLLDDQSQKMFNLFDLIYFINNARARIASETQCLRVLAPSSGSLSSVTIGAGGTAYTAPTLAVSAPDNPNGTQATATATLTGGVISGVTVTNAGSGYVQPATIAVTDTTGTGASLLAVLSPHINTVPGQEVYPYASFNGVITAVNPAIKSLVAVQGVSISYGVAKPTLDHCAWSELQAYLRSTGIGQTSFPQVWAEYAQGVTGSLYLWPIPSVYAAMDIDAYCLPIDLVNDTTVEAIPYPWTDIIPYRAAYRAFQSKRMRDDAQYMFAESQRMMREARMFVTPAMVPSMYG